MLNLDSPTKDPAPPLALESLGWNPAFEKSFGEWPDKRAVPGRVAVVDKNHFLILTPAGELSAHPAGKLRHEARSEADLPKVGDWVIVSRLPNESKAVIQSVLPRQTKLSRKVPGRLTGEQVLAANVDVAFLVQALDKSFNPRLLQRHLVMALQGHITPVVVLNKVDLCDDLPEKIMAAREVAGAAPVLAVSAMTGRGMETLLHLNRPGLTAVFIGSSGVGKSSLINELCGEDIQATTEVREWDGKGRHTTTRRELIFLPKGGLVIDTPGMREFALWTADAGLDEAFQDFETLAVRCRFRDCTHTVEKHCAVLEAIANAQLPTERYESYLKLKREVALLDAAQDQRSYAEKKRQTKVAQRAFNRIKRRSEDRGTW